MFESYEPVVEYLYNSLPMFQRIGAAALKPDLSNTIRLCAALDHPEKKFKSVHIAGTNGKGSSSHMIASILQEAGYVTGLYTSPHLKEFTERIRLNGTQVPRAFVVDFVNRIKPQIEIIKPSFFELTVAMAFDYFAQSGVDIAVIETGLGGRLDSTNVITPMVSLITNIGWDHKDLLGDTLEKIAFEKAGIIKAGVPVVVSERQAEIDTVFLRHSAQLNSALRFASDHYDIKKRREQGSQGIDVIKDGVSILHQVELPLLGDYQQKNVAGVLATIDVLREAGMVIKPDQIVNGLKRVIVNTHLKGRWQVLSQRPLMVCDTGHNVDGIREIVLQIGTYDYNHLYMVLGFVKDKDIGPVLEMLPKEATYYFCQAHLPRALPAVDLMNAAEAVGLRGAVIPDVNAAIGEAVRRATPNDFIFVGGSNFVVAEIENL